LVSGITKLSNKDGQAGQLFTDNGHLFLPWLSITPPAQILAATLASVSMGGAVHGKAEKRWLTVDVIAQCF
jgi:hypothetical protein